MHGTDTNITVTDSYVSFRQKHPMPSLPPRESYASTSPLLVHKKCIIASYCACFGKKEPVLNNRTVEPLELAAYIASFHNMPKADKTELQYHIVRIASCILDRAEQEKQLMRTKRENFHSFEKKCQQFDDAYIDGDALKATFYFEALHNRAYAAIYPVPMLTALHKSYTGRKILPPLLLGRLDALEREGLTLETAIKTYYALEARGELDGMEIMETLGQTKQRGRKVDEEAIKLTTEAFYAVLAKHPEDKDLRAELFKKEVHAHMDTLGQKKKHRQSTVDALWKEVPEERKLIGRPKGSTKSDNKA